MRIRKIDESIKVMDGRLNYNTNLINIHHFFINGYYIILQNV